MKRPGYREAIEWLAYNDDCHWLGDEGRRMPSVTASLVCDLFGVSEDRLIADLQRALKFTYRWEYKYRAGCRCVSK